MKTSLKSVLLAVVFFTLFSAKGQNNPLSIYNLIFPDTSYMETTDSVWVTVQNTGSTSYTGFIQIWFGTNTNSVTAVPFCINQQVTINAFDTIKQPCTITFDTSNFVPGSNIVVVWSSGNNLAPPADSSWTQVYLKTGAGIKELKEELSFSLFPLPAQNVINLNFENSYSLPERVRILDLFGIEIKTFSFQGRIKPVLDISQIPLGMYFIEASLNGRKSTRKFIKSE